LHQEDWLMEISIRFRLNALNAEHLKKLKLIYQN